MLNVETDLRGSLGERRFATILADPPWQFANRTGKIAPEHRRLSRYGTMTLDEITKLPISDFAERTAHLYLWCPNALLPEGLAVMKAWGFNYKSNIVWHKVRKDGGCDGRGVGFYFRNVTELILFGVRGKHARTLAPGRRQVNLLALVSASTRGSRMNNTRSLRPARRDHLSSYLRVVSERGGRLGAIKQMTIILQPGELIAIALVMKSLCPTAPRVL